MAGTNHRPAPIPESSTISGSRRTACIRKNELKLKRRQLQATFRRLVLKITNNIAFQHFASHL